MDREVRLLMTSYLEFSPSIFKLFNSLPLYNNFLGSFRPLPFDRLHGDNLVMVICLITSFMDDPFHVCVMCGGCIEVPRMLRP